MLLFHSNFPLPVLHLLEVSPFSTSCYFLFSHTIAFFPESKNVYNFNNWNTLETICVLKYFYITLLWLGIFFNIISICKISIIHVLTTFVSLLVCTEAVASKVKVLPQPSKIIFRESRILSSSWIMIGDSFHLSIDMYIIGQNNTTKYV